MRAILRRISAATLTALAVTVLMVSSSCGMAMQAADERPTTETPAVTATGPVWYGAMDVGPRVFRFAISSIDPGTGISVYQLTSLDEGHAVFVLSPCELTDSRLTFELKRTGAVYSGVRSDDGKTITGKWQQSGSEFDLVLQQLAAVPADQPAEVWAGQLSTLFQKLEIQFRVYRQEDGFETVYLDSVSQKAGGFTASRTVVDGEWTLEIPAIKASYTGKISEDGSEVDGIFTQGGLPIALVLSRREQPETAVVSTPQRPQTPRPPFPYEVRPVTFENKIDNVRLAGTLTRPLTSEPVPVVVLISGSGPQDRDETIVEHKPFSVLADHLSRHGIAVLRYDDRGVGESTGDFAAATSEDFSRDAEAALDFLKQQSDIDPAQIGLMGHSEGGLVAPMVAARRSDVAFVVLLAGTGVNGRDILISQGQLILKAAGVTDQETLQHQQVSQTLIVDTVVKADPQQPAEEIVQSLLVELKQQGVTDGADDAALQAAVRGGIERLRTDWFRYFLVHEPVPVLEQVKCPVLALNGSHDAQVDPQLNLPPIAAALKKAGNPLSETIELPGLNHLFQTSATGALQEYVEIEETVAPVALETVTAWIRKVTRLED